MKWVARIVIRYDRNQTKKHVKTFNNYFDAWAWASRSVCSAYNNQTVKATIEIMQVIANQVRIACDTCE